MLLTFYLGKGLMDKTSIEQQAKDQQILDALRSEGSNGLKQFYESYRNDFMAFARKYTSAEEDVLDVYQDTVIAFYENVSREKIKTLRSSLKTYLFSIGKYKLIDHLKRKGKTISSDDPEYSRELIDDSVEEKIQLNEQQTQLKQALNQLGEQCRDLLLLFYYRRYSIDAIREEMNYKNDNVVKAHKSRCMKKLRTLFKENNS